MYTVSCELSEEFISFSSIGFVYILFFVAIASEINKLIDFSSKICYKKKIKSLFVKHKNTTMPT